MVGYGFNGAPLQRARTFQEVCRVQEPDIVVEGVLKVEFEPTTLDPKIYSSILGFEEC